MLDIHNDRQPEDENEPVELPSIEMMAHRDIILAEKGYKVH